MKRSAIALSVAVPLSAALWVLVGATAGQAQGGQAQGGPAQDGQAQDGPALGLTQDRLGQGLTQDRPARSDPAQDRHTLPEGFVYLDEAIPEIVIELKYATADNFVGESIDGYTHEHAILAEPAAAALAGVQAALQPFGFGLKVFDAYRPQRAVNHFVRWGRDLDDRRNKSRFYPDVAKADLFEQGYIAERSGHSRGSTVDVTIVYRDDAGRLQELDMGSGYDFFGPISWPDSPAVSAPQRANRALLQSVMTAHGFLPYAKEWWHFTLADEPWPDTYFDFPN